MTYYAMGEVTVRSIDWADEYLSKINAFISRHGGRVLSRTLRMEKLEGERELPTNVILIEFSDRAAALSFFSDPEYQPIRQLRLDGSQSEFVIFPAEDFVSQ